MASVFLGTYYNLSVWYKLTNKTWTGAWITISGAVITIVLNIWWIPIFGYTGSAWATFICYLFMMITSYVLGQKHYPIPYAWKKLAAFVLIAVILYGVQLATAYFIPNRLWIITGVGLLLFVLYALLIAKVERKELAGLPVVGKYFRGQG
jgi:O-antigen/teichoic acid export membrane protein